MTTLRAALTRLLEADARTRRERAVERIERRLARALAAAFRAQGRAFVRGFVASAPREAAGVVPVGGGRYTLALREVGEPVDWDSAWRAAALDTLAAFTEPLELAILAALRAGSLAALGTFALDLSFDLENPRAVAYARAHAAELIKGINETTREGLRRIIVAGLDEGASYGQIGKTISSLFDGFSAKRAQTIAVYEVGEAYEQGNLDVADELRGSGVEMEKSWLTVKDSKVETPICGANEAQGWIPLAQPFQSGHDRATGHLACRCTTLLRRKPDARRKAT